MATTSGQALQIRPSFVKFIRRLIGSSFYWLGRLFLAGLLLIFGPVRVEGRSNVPKSGGLLVLCNHISDADPPVVGHALPRRCHFMAKSELFAIPLLGPFIRFLGAYPVRRGEPDRAAIRHTVELLQSGECVVLFPEGEVSEFGELLPIMPGAGLIARLARVPVICCGVRGTRRIIPYRSVIPRPAFGKVGVRFGAPRIFDEGVATDEILRWVAEELRALTSDEGGCSSTRS